MLYAMLKQFEAAHKIATSGLLENVVVTKTLTRDYVCKNYGCPSEQYCSSDWEETLTVYDDLVEFLRQSNPDPAITHSIRLTGECSDSEVTIFFKPKRKK